MKAFLSYSHTDEWALNRLHAHLAMLRREAAIVEWYDREILAGAEIDQEIAHQLEECELFLPLVSPDFLNSNYCFEKEMAKAIQFHAEGKARIVPIIVEPCDWHSSPLRRFKALPKDGKPITEWTNHNNAFLDIVSELRKLVSNDSSGGESSAPERRIKPDSAEGRRYRAKREFDDIDRSDFRKKSFEEIQNYFRSSISEINSVTGIKGRFEILSAGSFTGSIVNEGLERGVAHITVHTRSGERAMGDIYYSFSENAPPNTAHGFLNIESDEYDLFLRRGLEMQLDPEDLLSPLDAAELLWAELLQRAGISYD